jgi:hypothetical protein
MIGIFELLNQSHLNPFINNIIRHIIILLIFYNLMKYGSLLISIYGKIEGFLFVVQNC